MKTEYTYEIRLVRVTPLEAVEVYSLDDATHVGIYRRPVSPDADGCHLAEWLYDIPVATARRALHLKESWYAQNHNANPARSPD